MYANTPQCETGLRSIPITEAILVHGTQYSCRPCFMAKMDGAASSAAKKQQAATAAAATTPPTINHSHPMELTSHHHHHHHQQQQQRHRPPPVPPAAPPVSMVNVGSIGMVTVPGHHTHGGHEPTHRVLPEEPTRDNGMNMFGTHLGGSTTNGGVGENVEVETNGNDNGDATTNHEDVVVEGEQDVGGGAEDGEDVTGASGGIEVDVTEQNDTAMDTNEDGEEVEDSEKSVEQLTKELSALRRALHAERMAHKQTIEALIKFAESSATTMREFAERADAFIKPFLSVKDLR